MFLDRDGTIRFYSNWQFFEPHGNTDLLDHFELIFWLELFQVGS